MLKFNEWLLKKESATDFDLADADDDETFAQELKRKSPLQGKGDIRRPLRLGSMDDVVDDEQPPEEEGIADVTPTPDIPHRHNFPISALRKKLIQNRQRRKLA